MDSKKHITASRVEEAQAIIQYHFLDETTLWEALQAPGSVASLIGHRRAVEGNKRLALLGDALLRVAIVQKGYSEGEYRGDLFLSGVCQRLQQASLTIKQ